MRYRDLRGALAASVAIYAVAVATPAMAQTKSFDVPAQSAATGIPALATQADVQILVSEEAVRGKTIRAIKGAMSVDQAIRRVAADAGLRIVSSDGRTWALAPANTGNAATPTADDDNYRPAEIIVTAQKFAQRVQDVPIAITALDGEALGAQKIEGGSDLLRAIPNVTFSKSNFTGYNFSIRGIGTKAISATTDAGVSVALNSSTLIQNRLFEQEYFDVERVEVLRGPQGTLYGRDATGGVVNLITKKPDLKEFSGEIKGEVGNYDSRRLSAVINLPLSDRFGLRAAGAMTQRDGYGFNDATGNRIDGRDLWSARLSARWEPTDWLTVDLMGERFQENDNRARTTKQLCHKDEGPDSVAGIPIAEPLLKALFSTGCKAGSLYDDAAYDTPNGLALPYIFAIPAMSSVGGGVPSRTGSLIGSVDPYDGVAQNKDIRTIYSLRDPEYRAKANVVELNLEARLSDTLTFFSQSLYNDDRVYSTQDYNRFNSKPIFNDTSNWLRVGGPGPSEWVDMAPGGIFCDPQLGCSNTIVGQDISRGRSKQYSQEFRLQSSFDGPFNFSIGANYTHFKYEADYYVFINTLTALAMMPPLGTGGDYTLCKDGNTGQVYSNGDPAMPALVQCPYIDPNPLASINGDGHNYFRSRNPYKLESYAIFGETYWNITPELKLTAGLRVTRDTKTFTPVPSQLLLSTKLISGGGGAVSRGYPEDPDIVQRWTKPTGRIVLDWKPETSFSDDTMLYASYSRGYKAGGANPPSIGLTDTTIAEQLGLPPGVIPIFERPILQLTAVNYPATFRPEYVNAFEIGTKNSFMGGALTLNATAFYYDYKDYQVSKIVDRTAVNENFDAKVYGLEFETMFAPTERLLFNANLGLMKTKIGKGAQSIDLMNRTQGNPDYMVVKPWMQLPSNCVVPVSVVEYYLDKLNNVINAPGNGGYNPAGYFGALCGGSTFDGGAGGQDTGQIVPLGYQPANNPNGGAGFYADLAGNELPNSPHFTVNIGAQYSIPFSDGWEATLRGDYYRQGKSFARVYNTVSDRLRGWDNVNLSVRIANVDNGLTFEAYVKNVFNKAPITDAFLNSDDSGLTTNVFTLDPRIVGFSIAKKF